MDHRIFNVRTFLCVRVHTGVAHTDESAHYFDSEKQKNILGLRIGTLYQLSHHNDSLLAGTKSAEIAPQ